MTQCLALAKIPREAYPVEIDEEVTRAYLAGAGWTQTMIDRFWGDVATLAGQVQFSERAFGMSRDLAQKGVVDRMCERNAELVDLINRNNAEAES